MRDKSWPSQGKGKEPAAPQPPALEKPGAQLTWTPFSGWRGGHRPMARTQFLVQPLKCSKNQVPLCPLSSPFTYRTRECPFTGGG